MRYLFLTIALVGCAPALSPRDVCLNACETRGDECRAQCPSNAQETIVGVEYAGMNLSPLWTCEAGMAFYVRNTDGTLPAKPEVIRARGFGKTEASARGDAIQHALALYFDFKEMNHVTADDLVPETRAFLDKKQRFNWMGQRCWKRDQEPHPDLAGWLPATWPRPRTVIKDMTNGTDMHVPAGLVWNPDKPVENANTWSCKGAVYFRVRVDNDLTEVYEIVAEKSGLAGPITAAESELRTLLIAHARAKSVALCGDSDKMVLDTMGGALDATPIKCWQGIKTGAPVDWRGPTMW